MKNKKAKVLIIATLILFLIVLIYFLNYKCDFNGTWVRNLNTDGETIYFGKLGHFSYYTSEGNAVDDYDLCSFYTYNKRRNYIRLWCDSSFDGIKKLKILDKNSKRLKISFDGDIRVFEKDK